MKIYIELDPNDDQDMALLRRVLPANEVATIMESGKRMSKAAADLGKAIGGERPKLSTKQRASVAAKAKWAKRARLAKEAKGLRPSDVVKPKPERAAAPAGPRKEQDFADAAELPLGSFEAIAGDGLAVQAPAAKPEDYVPDGREILDGTFTMPAAPARSEDDEHVREVDRIAAEFSSGKQKR